ncbi:hypothetical protein ACEXQB_001725 [Herbiconiux sp. P18]|uniref:hypothetical protein n=1 Tax=Herbiconiux liangxiaofengii TaxID=3342795 RepID=UPI0035B7B253
MSSADPGSGRRTRAWLKRLRMPVPAFVAVFALASATVGANASWTAPSVPLGQVSANAASATVSAGGTASLTHEYRFTAATAPTANLVLAPLTFQNTGTAPLALSIAVTTTNGTLAAKIALTLWTAASCGTTVPATGVTAGTLQNPPALPGSFSSVAAGASVVLCAATRLSGTVAASQGETTTATLVLTGRVGTSWTATSTPPAFTQNVYRVGSPTAVTCSAGALGSVNLGWTAPAVPSGGSVSYRVVKTNAPATVVKQNVTGTSTSISPLEPGLDVLTGSGPLPVSIEAIDSLYGTTSAGTSIATTYSVVFPALLTIRCPA